MARRTAKPEKAYKSEEFLASADARPLRILSEFIEPFHRFRRQQIKDTIVFFGSAKVKPRKDALRDLHTIQHKVRRSKRVSPALQDKLRDAETDVLMSCYYEDAVELARRLTEWSKKLYQMQRFVICSGGGPGIMEAANKGAFLAGGKSIGLNISLAFEQFANSYITKELNFEFHYFFMRKFWFVYLAKALVMFPGGFGTLDELMEVLTLIQTKKTKKKMTVLLYGRDYWERIINFQALLDYRVVSAADLKIFAFADNPDDAFKYLTRELKRNYPVNGPSL